MTTITVGGNTYTLITMPARPGAADMSLTMNDTIGMVASPYVPSMSQAFAWPGADGWEGQFVLPPMGDDDAAEWEGFLAGLRGQLNVFQLGDPRRTTPRGNAQGSAPKVFPGNSRMGTTVNTYGWRANTARVLLRGDLLQLGFHLYRVCEAVNADGSGHATITVWPSLREAPTVDASVIIHAPVGLWRLADNRRTTQFSPVRLTSTSFKLVEVR